MAVIKLLGEAGRRFGRQFELAVKTPAEAVRALCLQLPELRQYLVESGEKGITWRVITESPQGLDEEQLLWPMSKRMVLVPLPTGRGGVGKIIAGVALVAAAIVFAPGGLLAGSIFGFTLGSSAAVGIGALGASLIFGGVADLLTPTPKVPSAANFGSSTSGRDEEEQLNAYTFDKSNANTAQGEAIAILYGERIIGALPVVSFGLEIQNSA